jgi:hypothetical protein
MVAKYVLLFLALQCSGTAVAQSVKAQELGSPLDKNVTSYSLGPSNLIEALIRVSNDFKIPMGIVWVDSPSTRARIPFAWKNVTVRQILDTILNTQQGYEALVKSGVVLVSPSHDLIPDIQNFLKLKLQYFEVHGDFVEVASFKLHMQICPRKYGQVSMAATGDSKVDLQLKNPTVEDTLNALVVASNRKIWIVTFEDGTALTSKGMRRTASLWNAKPQPDEEQPGWDLIRWGDPLPAQIAHDGMKLEKNRADWTR